MRPPPPPPLLHRGIGRPPFPSASCSASPREGLPSTNLPCQGCRMHPWPRQCLEPARAHTVPAPITYLGPELVHAWGALASHRLLGPPSEAPSIAGVLLVSARCPWSGRGREGGCCVGGCVCGTDTPVHPQPEEVAQEAVEEPLVEPLLEPEGENYEEPPQVRGWGGWGAQGTAEGTGCQHSVCRWPSLSGAKPGACLLPGARARSPAASQAGWHGAGGHRGSVLHLGSLTGSFFPHPTGGIPGIRARGIMDPHPRLFHQQHNEPPVAPCSSPAGPGRCPRAGEEQGCPCPVRSRVLPPVPFQGTVSMSLYLV